MGNSPGPSWCTPSGPAMGPIDQNSKASSLHLNSTQKMPPLARSPPRGWVGTKQPRTGSPRNPSLLFHENSPNNVIGQRGSLPFCFTFPLMTGGPKTLLLRVFTFPPALLLLAGSFCGRLRRFPKGQKRPAPPRFQTAHHHHRRKSSPNRNHQRAKSSSPPSNSGTTWCGLLLRPNRKPPFRRQQNLANETCRQRPHPFSPSMVGESKKKPSRNYLEPASPATAKLVHEWKGHPILGRHVPRAQPS